MSSYVRKKDLPICEQKGHHTYSKTGEKGNKVRLACMSCGFKAERAKNKHGR